MDDTISDKVIEAWLAVGGRIQMRAHRESGYEIMLHSGKVFWGRSFDAVMDELKSWIMREALFKLAEREE